MDTPPVPPDQRRSSGRAFQVSKEEIQCPWIAWPTVLLGILAPLLWAWCLFSIRQLFQTGNTDTYMLYVYSGLSCIACFLCFTPLHDAAHWAIGRTTATARFVNEAIGRISIAPLLLPFPAFRHVHLLHHKYTNDPDKDPDFFSQAGAKHCLFQEFFYVYYCFSRYDEVPGEVWIEGLPTLAWTLLGLAYGVHAWGWPTMIWGVLLPQRLAVFYLAYCFDYVPHHEAQGSPQTNPYLTTKRIISFFGNQDAQGAILKWLLRLAVANQDAHVIHHLYPTLPFYSYHAVWERHEKELYQAGVQKTSLF